MTGRFITFEGGDGAGRAFLDIAAREPERCVVVDATKSEDEVAVWRTVSTRLLGEAAA